MKRTTAVFLSLIIILALALALPSAAQTPKNVIYLIGDGMGCAQVSLARLSLGDSAVLNMDTMRYSGFVKTHSANATVTDSAAAGTALATGFKTNNGMIGVTPDGKAVESILEASKKLGMATGLVTTTTITHATPASFGAHIPNRGAEKEIAVQLIENKIDVLLGGGKSNFVPATSAGGRDLLGEAKSAGYTICDTRDELLAANGGKVIGLFQDGALTTESPEPSLAEMTQKAMESLSSGGKGFFLMVEGGQIDWKCHDNNAEASLKQILDFDAAVGKALEFARANRNTLVVVTADHETGGLSIVSEGISGAKWSTGGHSGVTVPLFAHGTSANLFTGVMDNTDVPKRIARFLGIKDFAAPAK